MQPQKARPFLYYLIDNSHAVARCTIQLTAAYPADKDDRQIYFTYSRSAQRKPVVRGVVKPARLFPFCFRFCRCSLLVCRRCRCKTHADLRLSQLVYRCRHDMASVIVVLVCLSLPVILSYGGDKKSEANGLPLIRRTAQNVHLRRRLQHAACGISIAAGYKWIIRDAWTGERCLDHCLTVCLGRGSSDCPVRTRPF